MLKLILIFSLIVAQSVNAQEIKDTIFYPKIKEFNGYLSKITFESKNIGKKIKKTYRFYIFSEKPPSHVKFKFTPKKTQWLSETHKINDSTIVTKHIAIDNNEFWLKDTSLVLLFYGGTYPKSLKGYYHNLSDAEYRHRLPEFPQKNEIRKGKYTLNSVKISFTGYDYEEYKPFIGVYDYKELDEWFYFGKVILPDIVKSSNRYYIVNYIQ